MMLVEQIGEFFADKIQDAFVKIGIAQLQCWPIGDLVNKNFKIIALPQIKGV